MANTTNRERGELLVPDGIWLEGSQPAPTDPGQFRFDGTDFQMRDSTGTFNPRSGGSGITESQHEALDSLRHLIAEDCDIEVQRSGGRVDAVIVWTNSGHTQKIREVLITRSGGQVSTIVTKQYDGVGALKETYTQTVTRSSGQVATIAGVST